MKAKAKLVGTFIITVALAIVETPAQCGGAHGPPWRGGASCGWLGPQSASCPGNGCPAAGCSRANGQARRLYDPKTVQKISGEVIRVEKLAATGGSSGIHLQLKTEQGMVVVHVGPSWYLDNQEAQIVAKDKVEITGSQVTLDGAPVLIAAEIKKADGVLKLRDANGVPLWAGWRNQ